MSDFEAEKHAIREAMAAGCTNVRVVPVSTRATPHPDDLRPRAFWHDFKRGIGRVWALLHEDDPNFAGWVDDYVKNLDGEIKRLHRHIDLAFEDACAGDAHAARIHLTDARWGRP